MAVARRPSSRFRFLVAFLVLISLTLITLDASGKGNSALQSLRNATSSVLSPVQDGIHDALRPIGNFLTGAVDYGKVQADNTKLRGEVAQLRNEEAQSAYERQQASQVLAQDHLTFLGGIKTVAVQVTDIGASNFEDTVTISKGTSSGVLDGEPVVAAGGLAGTVELATSHSATVELVSEADKSIGVTLPDHNVGLATGQGPGESLKVTVVPTNAPTPKIKKGTTLSTSGEQNYPAGIPVGTVVSVSTPETGPVAVVKPLVNAAALQDLQVLLWSPQTTVSP